MDKHMSIIVGLSKEKKTHPLVLVKMGELLQKTISLSSFSVGETVWSTHEKPRNGEGTWLPTVTNVELLAQ